MNNSELSYGLNLGKKAGVQKSNHAKRKPIFGGDDDSDDERNPQGQAEEISELDGFSTKSSGLLSSKSSKASRNAGLSHAPPSKPKAKPPSQFGDLSSALTSRKYAEDAEKMDPSIYDYDASYDSFKAPKKAARTAVEADKKPLYMSGLKKAAEIRERDRKIAEDKKMQREREEEGDEFADKEKFVTEAYKKQQEENRRLEEEERRREEDEAKRNKLGGMTGFFKQLLDKGDQRHAEIMKAAEEQQKSGLSKEGGVEEEETVRTEADIAKEINEKGGSIAINEEGQVVDKRELLRGGLNVGAKKKAEVQKEAKQRAADSKSKTQNSGYFTGGKQAMRDRQSRMMEEQYTQALKRSRDEEEQERKKVESEAKSLKTGVEISSAKERYLARKRAEAEAKKNGSA